MLKNQPEEKQETARTGFGGTGVTMITWSDYHYHLSPPNYNE